VDASDTVDPRGPKGKLTTKMNRKDILAGGAAGGVGGAEAGGAILMIMLPKVLLVVLS